MFSHFFARTSGNMDELVGWLSNLVGSNAGTRPDFTAKGQIQEIEHWNAFYDSNTKEFTVIVECLCRAYKR